MNKQLTKEDWLTIAKSYESLGPTKLANKLGVSKGRISQVVSVLRRNGVNLPDLRGTAKLSIDFVKSNLTKTLEK